MKNCFEITGSKKEALVFYNFFHTLEQWNLSLVDRFRNVF